MARCNSAAASTRSFAQLSIHKVPSVLTSLVIVESPAKAKTISRFLGKDYRVEASYGHVRDLPSSRKELPEEYKSQPWADFAVNIDDQFQPVYIIPPDKKRHIAHLKSALKGAKELLLATDEDREGESISWHLCEVLKPKVPVRRIVFHEITREAIEEALRSPREIDENLVRAQEGRRVLDRLFGYKLSPLLWRKVQPGLSAGRVQSVAVRLIAEREEERARFRSAEYWDLEAEVATAGGSFKATLVSLGGQRLATGKDFDPSTGRLIEGSRAYLLDAEAAGDLCGAVRGALPWTVTRVEETPITQRPNPPFTTSTLQQEANRKLGFGAKRTMQIAQKLYEGVDLGDGERVGLITYMRTDSVTLSNKALGEAQRVIAEIYGPEYACGPRQYRTKTANAQEAHEAIRPTEISRRPNDVAPFLSREDLALYDLIWKRTVASQMPDARLLRTTVELTAETGGATGAAVFTASGKKILFPGFLRAYVEGSDDPAADLGDKEVILPDLKVGEKVYSDESQARAANEAWLVGVTAKRHETTPPPRYTEASLVKKLEEEGIGRPSTYASIISTIQDRGYVFLNKSRQLVPTFTAMTVTQLLREHFAHYVDLRFTARMEEELDNIANGDLSWVEHIREFYRGTPDEPGLETLVETKQQEIERPEIVLGVDSETSQPVRVRVGKYGPYVVVGDNGNGTLADIPPDVAPADFNLESALELIRQKAEGPRRLGEDPATGLPVYVLSGRYGAYVQLGDNPAMGDRKAPKPRRASLEPGMTAETITLAQALQLLRLPRELGRHPESGEPVLANNGRWGPYVQHGKEFRSLPAGESPYTVTLERALDLLAAPKAPRGRRTSAQTPIKEFPGGIRLMEGRYGPYVTDGKVNATLPKTTDPESVTAEQAAELIAAKAAARPKKAPKRRTTRKAT
jgi:DNA topoisomerase-1